MLRFPEFRKAGEWELKKLGDLLDYLQPTKYLVSSTTYDEKYDTPVLTAGKTFILGYTNETEGVFDGKLPVIIFDDFTTASKYVDFPFKAKSSAMKILLAKNDVNIMFVYESMQMIKYEVGAHERHWIATFSKLRIPAPSPKEQQKIADCLSSVEALISAERQKLDTLKTHKNGLMQQLFPAEGEIIPKQRFAEFRGREGWVKKKISDLFEKVSNPVVVDPTKVYREIGIRSHGKGIFHKEPIKGAKLGNKRVFWVEDNTFVVNIVFAWELAVANTTEAEKGMIASHRFPMYKAYKNKAVANYIKYFFLTNKGKELLWIASPGGAGRNKTLGQKEFEKLEFLIPTFVDEQKKIADCLTSIDEKITTQSQKLDALKAHKKALMQKLLPAMDEVEA